MSFVFFLFSFLNTESRSLMHKGGIRAVWKKKERTGKGEGEGERREEATAVLLNVRER